MNGSGIGKLQKPQELDCSYHPTQYLEERFWLVSVIGTSVASISIIQNTFLFAVLVANRAHRQSYVLYLILLAFFDVLIAGAYIPLMSVSQLADYYMSPVLLRAWYTYMVPMITISHIAMTSSSFLILAATFERYCITVVPQLMGCLNRYRDYIAAFVVLIGVVTKSSLSIEFQIKQNVDCAGTMAEYTLGLSATALNPTYNVMWRFWFRNIITILLPFFLLAFLNAQIVIVLQRNQHTAPADELSKTQMKYRVRAATRTLVFVVFTYLLSNVLNVIITIWEYIDMETLMTEYVGLYIFCADLVSLLTTLAGSLRLSIYAMCQPQLRLEFKHAACEIFKLPLKAKSVLQSLCRPVGQNRAVAAVNVDNKAPQPVVLISVQCQPLCDGEYDEVFL